MELSLVIDDDGERVKFKEGTKTMVLSRQQIEMGLRFLNAAIESSPLTPAQTPVAPTITDSLPTENGPIRATSPQTPTKAKEVRPRPDVNKAKFFLQEIENQNKRLSEEGNTKAVGTELAFRRAVLKTKDRIDFESMARAMQVSFGMPRERFEIIYSQAGTLNDSE